MTDTCRECGRPKGGSLARGQCIITGGDACRLNTISILRARVAELEKGREAVRVAVERAKSMRASWGHDERTGVADAYGVLVDLIEELEKI